MTIRHLVKYLLHKRTIIQPVIIPTIQGEMLKDKIALITGGASGLGQGIARAFVSNGAKVILTGTNLNKLQSFCLELGAEHAVPYIWDLRDVDGYADHWHRCLSLYPRQRIDVLVNNAGVLGILKFGEVTEDVYDSVLNVNLKGPFFMAQICSNYFISERIAGRILNISSASALKPASVPYGISKWGIRGFTMGLARELIPHGIVVNGIGPGPCATTMIRPSDESGLSWETNPSKRLCTPEEIGNLATFLVSFCCGKGFSARC